MLPLSIVYVASAFGWRTWKQWRTTGDTGLRRCGSMCRTGQTRGEYRPPGMVRSSAEGPVWHHPIVNLTREPSRSRLSSVLVSLTVSVMVMGVGHMNVLV